MQKRVGNFTNPWILFCFISPVIATFSSSEKHWWWISIAGISFLLITIGIIVWLLFFYNKKGYEALHGRYVEIADKPAAGISGVKLPKWATGVMQFNFKDADGKVSTFEMELVHESDDQFLGKQFENARVKAVIVEFGFLTDTEIIFKTLPENMCTRSTIMTFDEEGNTDSKHNQTYYAMNETKYSASELLQHCNIFVGSFQPGSRKISIEYGNLEEISRGSLELVYNQSQYGTV
jgi:hypothetical protein